MRARVFPRSQDRKEAARTPIGAGSCENLMTENGNDRTVERLWRKGRKQWSIKKKKKQELRFCQILCVWCQDKGHIPEAGSESAAQKGQDTRRKAWMGERRRAARNDRVGQGQGAASGRAQVGRKEGCSLSKLSLLCKY